LINHSEISSILVVKKLVLKNFHQNKIYFF
jgi:hypothetical protein